MAQEPIVSREICENLNQLMSFPSEGIFTRVLTKSESFSCALICLTRQNDIYMHALNSLAELAALIAERARADLRGHGIEVFCSAPVVLRAQDAQLSTLATAPIDSVPMECSFGRVLLEAFVG